eukprot:CAMPEP_0194483526 /NCGR_PEP_ID=MMETSP0253-20130528/5096_1 /TAXON_ID=2966 /ORGANISM="Noctiluca scintillans" /LENGTH=174 /DNA_ID=CAMNT_0039323193 /DNA_START=69 /DNA_END=593 /DNA_ORIENTATION=-
MVSPMFRLMTIAALCAVAHSDECLQRLVPHFGKQDDALLDVCIGVLAADRCQAAMRVLDGAPLSSSLATPVCDALLASGTQVSLLHQRSGLRSRSGSKVASQNIGGFDTVVHPKRGDSTYLLKPSSIAHHVHAETVRNVETVVPLDTEDLTIARPPDSDGDRHSTPVWRSNTAR